MSGVTQRTVLTAGAALAGDRSTEKLNVKCGAARVGPDPRSLLVELADDAHTGRADAISGGVMFATRNACVAGRAEP